MNNKGGTSVFFPIYTHTSPILDERSRRENEQAMATTSESNEILQFAFGPKDQEDGMDAVEIK